MMMKKKKEKQSELDKLKELKQFYKDGMKNIDYKIKKCVSDIKYMLIEKNRLPPKPLVATYVTLGKFRKMYENYYYSLEGAVDIQEAIGMTNISHLQSLFGDVEEYLSRINAQQKILTGNMTELKNNLSKSIEEQSRIDIGPDPEIPTTEAFQDNSDVMTILKMMVNNGDLKADDLPEM